MDDNNFLQNLKTDDDQQGEFMDSAAAFIRMKRDSYRSDLEKQSQYLMKVALNPYLAKGLIGAGVGAAGGGAVGAAAGESGHRGRAALKGAVGGALLGGAAGVGHQALKGHLPSWMGGAKASPVAEAAKVEQAAAKGVPEEVAARTPKGKAKAKGAPQQTGGEGPPATAVNPELRARAAARAADVKAAKAAKAQAAATPVAAPSQITAPGVQPTSPISVGRSAGSAAMGKKKLAQVAERWGLRKMAFDRVQAAKIIAPAAGATAAALLSFLGTRKAKGEKMTRAATQAQSVVNAADRTPKSGQGFLRRLSGDTARFGRDVAQTYGDHPIKSTLVSAGLGALAGRSLARALGAK